MPSLAWGRRGCLGALWVFVWECVVTQWDCFECERAPTSERQPRRPAHERLVGSCTAQNQCDCEGAARGACSMWQNPTGTSRQLDFPRCSLSTLGPPPTTPLILARTISNPTGKRGLCRWSPLTALILTALRVLACHRSIRVQLKQSNGMVRWQIKHFFREAAGGNMMLYTTGISSAFQAPLVPDAEPFLISLVLLSLPDLVWAGERFRCWG